MCRALKKRSIQATFFVCGGPDNMGRHLWRLLKPAFFLKMMRTKAASLYGWDIIFKGTLWPGPDIGEKLGYIIRAAADDGHEIGLHAWDHHAWQARIDKWSAVEVHAAIERGVNRLGEILGRAPDCSAAPGWKAHDTVLREKARFPFRYNSDCRGTSVFRPVVDGAPLGQPQIPTTLPTYDEVFGRDGITNANYNEHLLSLMSEQSLNVLCAHTESEGIACFDLFEHFLDMALARGVQICPLGQLLPANHNAPPGRVVPRVFPGREGWIACQE